MRQARTSRPAPTTARETAESPKEEPVRPKSEGADPGEALARAETFGHRFADLSVQPIQRKGGKGKGKGKGNRRPQRQAPQAEEPAEPRDDRNWWQRNAPYLVGGKAPQEDRNWWRRSMPYVLGGTAQRETRGYWGRVAPTFLGGQPVPGGPQAEPPRLAEAPQEAEPAPVVAENPPPVVEEGPPAREAPAPGKGKRKGKGKGKAPRVESDSEPEAGPAPKPHPVPERASDSDSDDGGPKTKQQKRRAQKARRREREEAERAEAERRRAEAERQRARQQELERARQLRAARRLPRRVVRHDRDFDSLVNSKDQGKAHRVGQDLLPAGDTPVTATEQLHQDSPNKGTSNRISFASLRAAAANDYSRGGRNAAVHFKFRKWWLARSKGKKDARGFDALSHEQVLQGIQGRGTRAQQQTARNYANRDGEHQTIGRIPARFLHWEGQAPGGYDSDSDGAETEDEG